MEDGHTLFDYDVGLNEIVQLMIRNVDLSAPVAKETTTNKAEEQDSEDMDMVCVCVCVCSDK